MRCVEMNFLETLTNVNNAINDFVWVKLGLILLLGTGVLMTILTKFFQVSHLGHWMKNTMGSLTDKNVSAHTGKQEKAISQFQSLCTALAATVGVGNIAGVAAAICSGGAGAVFWMWVAAFFGMMTNYSENVLGIYYRRRNEKGEWAGGAMYFLRDGLGSIKGCKIIGKVLAVLFSIFCLLASFGIGNMGQVNKIVANIESAFRIDALSEKILYSTETGSVSLYALIIGIALMILAGLIILGGLKRIAAFAEKVVPVMVVLYVVGSIVVIGANYAAIGDAFKAIFTTAFAPKAVWGGVTGIAIKTVVTWGFKRGVFSNEAGLGSSVMVHSSSNIKEPVKQGMWGIFEVFADTMVICTMTALVVLTSGVIDLETGNIVAGAASDATLVASAFNTVFTIGGVSFGDKFVAVAILLFAFTTVLGWSHYGTIAFEYLFGTKAIIIYRVFFVAMIISGAVLTSSIAWDISDTFNGLMMIPNLIGVLTLSGVVLKITKNYVDRKIKGKKNVKPMLSAFPEIQMEQEAEMLKEEANVITK